MNWEAVTAICTFFAVVVALFGDRIRKRLFSEKINISVATPLSDLNCFIENNQQKQAHYYHLNVSNDGCSVSSNTIVYLTNISATINSTKYVWNGEIPLSWEYGQVMGRISWNILSKDSHNCDLFCITEDGLVVIETIIMPNNLHSNFIGPFSAELCVCAKSNDIISREKTFEVKWDGKWDKDPAIMSEHIFFKDIS